VLRQAPFGGHLVAWFDEFTGASDLSALAPAPHRSFVRSVRDAFELAWVGTTVWQYLSSSGA
jgi:hypothetical protein